MTTKTKNQHWEHLGVIAGGGALPVILANETKANGKAVCVASLQGFADQDWGGFTHREFTLEEIAAICTYFRDAGVEAITFAGNVGRPDFSTYSPTDLAKSSHQSLQNAARLGDDSLLRSVIGIFESAGFSVIGVADIAADYLVPTGFSGCKDAISAAQDDCRKASQIARKIGALDIGQSAVICRGVVLAVEAQEGTDNMLARCAGLPVALRGTVQNRCGVFAKWAKPTQDRRIDLPVVGVSTIKAVARAGLAGLALEAGGVILLEPEKILEIADKLNVFILGMETGD